jgi:dihydroorotate dehydrogenase electron transfer subunit
VTALRTTAVEIEPGLAEPEQGPRVAAPFGRRSCRVESNEAIGPYRLIAVDDAGGPAPLPGQFYMLASAQTWGEAGGRPHLARAFSVCRARGARLEFLLEAIGPGTGRLAALGAGEQVWLVGPLGIGFSGPEGDGRPLLVGGGIGIAPLVIWAEALRDRRTPPLSLLGFREGSYVPAARLLPGDVAVATDDGSGASDHHGFVTDLLEREVRPTDVVYACGPPQMLEAVRRICVQRAVPAQLAMEAAMACGFGACFGCVVRTRQGYRRLCVDGPVIAAEDLEEGWE